MRSLPNYYIPSYAQHYAPPELASAAAETDPALIAGAVAQLLQRSHACLVY
jgi:hypothetical protein